MTFRPLLFAASLLVPFAASAMGVTVIINGQSVVFKDVSESSWYSTFVKDAANLGIVNGYQDTSARYTGLFGPSDNVTIGQALKIAVEGAGYDKDLYSASINAGVGSHWAAPYVSVALGEKFLYIRSGMRLDRAATRAEVAALFASAFRVSVDTQAGAGYKDVSPGSAEAPSIAALTRDKVLTGDTDASGNLTQTFRPSDHINRAEMVKMVLLARAEYGEAGSQRTPTSY